ncbi:MAG: hypothetical protein A2162_08965 [Deltaproteobacteria bacterium RBG_13_52_11b]|nr:MAG: hypothetical protein A2162_08965 [Deltaproteobacteria bacterium RBG_13_52_11b]
MRRKNIFFLLLLLAVLMAGVVMTLGYPPRPRFFPLIVMSLCGVFVLVELVKTFRVTRESGSPDHEEGIDKNKQRRRKFAETTAWIGGFTLSIWLFGFVLGMPLFVLAYVVMNGEKWRWIILLPATMFVIVYVGFGLLLQSPLYEGWLFLR